VQAAQGGGGTPPLAELTCPRSLAIGRHERVRRARDGAIYPTYSTFARGLDGIWGMFQWLDRANKGAREQEPGGVATTSNALSQTDGSEASRCKDGHMRTNVRLRRA